MHQIETPCILHKQEQEYRATCTDDGSQSMHETAQTPVQPMQRPGYKPSWLSLISIQKKYVNDSIDAVKGSAALPVNGGIV